MNLIVRSKNTSCKDLRKIETPYRVIYRMGSSTPTSEILTRRKSNSKKPLLEINSPESCILSNDKIKMKRRFTHAKLPTAEWFTIKSYESGRQKVAYWLTKWKSIIVRKILLKHLKIMKNLLNKLNHTLETMYSSVIILIAENIAYTLLKMGAFSQTEKC